jgi:hypothetical protein
VWGAAAQHALSIPHGQQMNDETNSPQRTRRLRPCLVAFGLGLTLLVVGACGSDEPKLNYIAVAGEDCQDCRSCGGLINSCVCETCTELAYDPNKKQLLSCTGIWVVQKECPGGVSVVCAGVGYDITCLDEKGQPK